MRKDERGVVIPAPPQGSNGAPGGPRYGDKYRGPSVAEAYELSRCWTDLAEHSQEWPTPQDLPPLMVEQAEAIPEEQRASWLRRQANLDEVDRRILDAIRCGVLPIWVAPIGEPDRVIAPGELATIDKRSMQAEIFFPQSEEYKSEKHRPRHWAHPLFVKWADWVRFVSEVQADKSQHVSSTNGEGGSAATPFPDDAGWIKGLPTGWIDGTICARRLFARLKMYSANADPAPWHNVANADYWGPQFGKSAAEHERTEKLSERLVAIIQRAIATGKLTASWFDGLAFKRVPAQAFANSPVVRNALLLGGLEIDPLWPDEWQSWSGYGWAIPKSQFDEWMEGEGEGPLSMAGLPMTPEAIPSREVFSIDSRKPSESGRVPLSEAVTWIALGVALDAERLERAIQWERLCGGDLQRAQRQIEAASATLLKAGADGQVSFLGRHVESYGEKGPRTERIDPMALIDYRQILISGHDHLYYGEGLKRWYQTKNDTHLRESERRDFYINVVVARDELLKHFGSEWRGANAVSSKPGGNVPANRKLNHAEIIGQAASMRAFQPGISKGSAAASIVADLPRNPRSGKQRDTRHIERMIAHLWEGGLSQSPH